MKKGFTLIELLIVIAILAILATTIAVVMNPAQMLKEARDSQRMSDLKSIQSALALYLVSVVDPSFSGNDYCTKGTTGYGPADTSCTERTVITTDGNGWVDVNLDAIPTGSPLSALPLDPVNDSSYYYEFASNATGTHPLTFELNCNMESTKYSNGGSADVESTDGGNNNEVYEIGSVPGLNRI